MRYGFNTKNDGYYYTNNNETLFRLKMVKFPKDIYNGTIKYRTNKHEKGFYEAIAVIEDSHYSTYSNYINKNENNLKKIKGLT